MPGWLPFDNFCYAKVELSGNFSSALAACKELFAWLPISNADHVYVLTRVLRQSSFWVWTNVTNGLCAAAVSGVVYSNYVCSSIVDVLCAKQFYEN